MIYVRSSTKQMGNTLTQRDEFTVAAKETAAKKARRWYIPAWMN